jgi:hypothetical protein
MIEGGATLDGIGILYRSVLLPLSEDSVAIDHLLGAANSRLLREDEEMTSRTKRNSTLCRPGRAAGILPLAKVRWRRATRWRRLSRRGAGRPSWLWYCNVTFSPGRISAMGGERRLCPSDPSYRTPAHCPASIDT